MESREGEKEPKKGKNRAEGGISIDYLDNRSMLFAKMVDESQESGTISR